MMTGNRNASLWLILGFSIACAMLAFGILPVLVGAAAPNLPPRPTTPTPRPTPKPRSRVEPIGAWIELIVGYTDLGPSFAWGDLWTMVQWQDSQGRWHDVEGWGGNLDEVANGTGKKMWWVAESDFGAAPFRWVAQSLHNGEQLGESEPFTLPQVANETLQVEVMLAP